jgi:N-terminal domain of reverse transcriptase
VRTTECSANGTEGRTTTDWNVVDWRKVQRSVSNLRRRIFRASKQGEHRKVRSAQKLALRSYANTLWSVRRVTQINAGRNTPGVDMLVVKTSKARNELVDHIPLLPAVEGQSGKEGLHTESQRQDAAFGHPHGHRPGDASRRKERT